MVLRFNHLNEKEILVITKSKTAFYIDFCLNMLQMYTIQNIQIYATFPPPSKLRSPVPGPPSLATDVNSETGIKITLVLTTVRCKVDMELCHY